LKWHSERGEESHYIMKKKTNKKRIKVIGLGNPLVGDDGVGVAVINKLKQKSLPEDVEVIDVGCDPLAILEHLNCKKVIVVDAVKMGKKAGAVIKFTPDDVDIIDDSKNFSLHGIGLGYALKLARKFNKEIDVKIVGIEPFDVKVGNDISEKVLRVIPKAVNSILEELK